MVTNSELKKQSGGLNSEGFQNHYSLMRLQKAIEESSLENEFYLGGRMSRTGDLWRLQSGSLDWRVKALDTNQQLPEEALVTLFIQRIHCNIESREIEQAQLYQLHPGEQQGVSHFMDVNYSSAMGKDWFGFVQNVGDFFISQGLDPVHTPSLVACPGMEPTLDPIHAKLNLSGQSWSTFLPTSPELHIKKYIAGGGGDCFEIKDCFRDGEVSSVHEPEFKMLEWYRTFADLGAIKADLQNLWNWLANKHKKAKLTRPMLEVSLPELFRDLTGIILTPQTTQEELLFCCKKWGYYVSDKDSFNDLFFQIFLNKVDPWLIEQKDPLILKYYPPSQSALAKLTPEGWADRFEWYWQGLELGNAFNELTIPLEQEARFKKDNLDKLAMGKEPLPLDKEFLLGLKRGLPPTAGIAVGMERLFLAFSSAHSLRELKPFSWNWRVSK